jgi:hypothetical protein
VHGQTSEVPSLSPTGYFELSLFSRNKIKWSGAPLFIVSILIVLVVRALAMFCDFCCYCVLMRHVSVIVVIIIVSVMNRVFLGFCRAWERDHLDCWQGQVTDPFMCGRA